MFTAPIEDLLIKALEDSCGKEICAIILEDQHGVQELIRMRNWSGELSSFFIATSELQRVERYAQRKGCKILALIHSHYSTLELSKQDRKGLKYSKYPWMVICLNDSKLHTKFYDCDRTLAQDRVSDKR